MFVDVRNVFFYIFIVTISTFFNLLSGFFVIKNVNTNVAQNSILMIFGTVCYVI